ncbi:protein DETOXIFICATION 16-like [Panicum miliaceum]|uniref:Protein DETOXIFICATION 16-like n=1 Tax=Panicum miliaceum TaxID=4540 RepID=A0A3L6RL43_PANMI|nr:protein DETOXIFICATION 16-like [Panicum miliaceum]
MATARDTLCGQAFGARQYHLLGVYKQRAMVVIALACAPFAVVCARAGPTGAPRPGPRRPRRGRRLRAVAHPVDPPQRAAAVPRPFLQTKGLVLPVAASSGAATLCHAAVCWLLVHKAGMGSKGAALSNAVSYAVNLAMLALYVRRSGACRRTRNGFSMEAFKDLRPFAALAVPSGFMIWFV